MNRRVVATMLVIGMVGALFVGVFAGSNTGSQSEAPVSVVPQESVTTDVRAPETGGIDVPDLPGTFAAPLPGLGFGLAIPDRWQATVLTDEALEQVADARLAEPFFIDAARNVATTGAIFYAAGIDEQGRVDDVKVDVQQPVDTSPDAVMAAARVVSEAFGLGAAEIVELGDGRVRVDYRIELPSAEGDELINVYGAQLLVPDGARLWLLTITTEDPDTRTTLIEVFQTGFVLSGP